jgi:hypothetical protein
MRAKVALAALVTAAGVSQVARAQISATASFSSQAVTAARFHYSGTLNNTGSTTIGTFWFAWIPGYDFLPSGPTNITSPPGWTYYVEGLGGGYSIQWTATTIAARLAAGANLAGFGFDSPDSPAVLRGPAPSFPFYPTVFSYIYDGAPELGFRGTLIPTVADACYANCDGSSTAPILNVNDFTCFLNKFATGDPTANCDGSSNPPILNVNDFTCFLNAYAGGCPQ